MVNVDTKNLKVLIDRFSELQRKYEATTINSFNAITHTSEFWQDDRSPLFYNKITGEKRFTEKLRINLKKRENIYQYIYREYASFGRIIACDLQQKEAILEKLNYGIERLDVIIGRFNNLDISFLFGKRDFLLKQKRHVVQLKKDWDNYRIKLRKFLEQVETIESEVKKRTQSLEVLAVEQFIFE